MPVTDFIGPVRALGLAPEAEAHIELVREAIDEALHHGVPRGTACERCGSKRDVIDSMLLLGPRASGKLDLLLRYAISHADRGDDVLLVCKDKDRMASAMQSLDFTPPTDALRHIHIRYVADGALLAGLFSSLHLAGFRPDVVIVDDLSGYCGPFETLQDVSRAAKLCALMDDGVRFLARQRESAQQSPSSRTSVALLASANVAYCMAVTSGARESTVSGGGGGAGAAKNAMATPLQLFTKWFPTVLRWQGRGQAANEMTLAIQSTSPAPFPSAALAGCDHSLAPASGIEAAAGESLGDTNTRSGNEGASGHNTNKGRQEHGATDRTTTAGGMATPAHQRHRAHYPRGPTPALVFAVAADGKLQQHQQRLSFVGVDEHTPLDPHEKEAWEFG